MSDYGHVKISRKAYAPIEAGGDPFWNEPREFSRWEAWEYLIQAAAWSDHKRIVAGDMVDVPRGHTPPLALAYLSQAWGWGTKRVRNFLRLLDATDRIRAVGGAHSGTSYLIMNYDYYQSQGQAKGQAEGMGEGTPGAGRGQQLEAGKAREAGKANTDSAKRKRQMPIEWEPNAKHHEIAAEDGLSIDRELERFRDYCEANAKTYADWDAGFRTWLRNAVKFGGRNGKAPTAADTQTYQPTEEWRGFNG